MTATPTTFHRWAATCGLAGCGLILLCVWTTMVPFVGMYGEPYSSANHFISELGDRRFSVFAPVFNNGVMAGSLLLLVFSIGFTGLFKGWAKAAVGLLGLVTSVACFLVGAIPEDNLRPHMLVATVFFHSALAMVFLCTALTLFARQPVLPKWTVVLGGLTAAAFAGFVTAPKEVLRAWIADPACFERPVAWALPILEWASFYAIIVWMLVAAVLMLRGRLQPQRAAG